MKNAIKNHVKTYKNAIFQRFLSTASTFLKKRFNITRIKGSQALPLRTELNVLDCFGIHVFIAFCIGFYTFLLAFIALYIGFYIKRYRILFNNIYLYTYIYIYIHVYIYIYIYPKKQNCKNLL